MSFGGGGGGGEGANASREGVKSPFLELPSKSTFFTAAFGVFGVGALGGVYQVMRREEFRFSLRAHRTPFAVAAKALFWGTALCAGSFAAGTAALMATTGISSFEEFANAASKRLATVDALQTKDPAVLADLQKIRRLSEQEEMDEWWERLFAGPPTPAKESNKEQSPP